MKRIRYWLYLFILIGILVRIAVVFITNSHINPELFEYEDVITHIFQGKGFTHSNDKFQLDYYAAIHPLFTFICAWIYWLTNHSYLAVEIFQILISVMCGLLVFKLASEIFNGTISLIAAILIIFHPGLIIYSATKIHSQVLDTFFFTLIAFWILKAKKTLRLSDFILLGVFIGIGSLARGTIIVILPIAILYYFLSVRINKIQLLKKVFVVLFATIVILLPWWIRNYLVFNKPVYMTTESLGYVLWVGFNDNATGTLYALNGKTQFDEAPERLKKEVYNQTDELAQQDVFRREAINFIRKNPVKSLLLYLKRLAYFWWFTPTQGFFYPKIYFMIYKLFYIISLLFALFGIFHTFKYGAANKMDISLLLTFIVGLGLLQGLYYVEGRHRWEIEPLLFIFVGYGMTNMYKLIFKNK